MKGKKAGLRPEYSTERSELIHYYRGRLAQIDTIISTLHAEREALALQVKKLREGP